MEHRTKLTFEIIFLDLLSKLSKYKYKCFVVLNKNISLSSM